jgi:hypothetical protein
MPRVALSVAHNVLDTEGGANWCPRRVGVETTHSYGSQLRPVRAIITMIAIINDRKLRLGNAGAAGLVSPISTN